MKRIFFCISLIISQAAMAGKTHTIELDEYWFRGTLNEMVDSLQERLAGEISVVCEKSPIKMNSLTINFKKGELAGSGPLITEIVNNHGKLLVDFPGHPKAVISASFDCP